MDVTHSFNKNTYVHLSEDSRNNELSIPKKAYKLYALFRITRNDRDIISITNNHLKNSHHF